MSSQPTTSADPCAAVLITVEAEKARLADEERQADLEAQAQAAKKANAAEELTLLASIGPANTAWDAAKGDLTRAVTAAWSELAPCLPTLDAALGADKDCMKQAYDGYAQKLTDLRADLKKKKEAQATAAAAADAAAATLAEKEALLSDRYSQFATYMGQRRDALTAAVQSFKAAMGSHPCDAKTAYILLRETQDIYQDFQDQAAKCLPEEMHNLILEIEGLQGQARDAQTAKLRADGEEQQASGAVDAAVADKAGLVMQLFAECKQPPPAPPGGGQYGQGNNPTAPGGTGAGQPTT